MKPILIAISAAALLAGGACTKDSQDKAPADPAAKTAAATPSTPASLEARQVMDLDRVIDRHFTALGGADKWRAATSMTYTISGEADGKVTVHKSIRQRPNMMRIENTMGDETSVKVFDGKVAAVSKAGKVETLEGDKAKGMAKYAQFDDILLDYKNSERTIELAGTEDIDGSPAHVITIAGEGETETRYIDSKTFFEVKRVVSWKHGEESGEKVMFFTDYRPVDGLMVNHGLIGVKDGKKNEMKVSDIGFNKTYEPDVFRLTEGDS